MDSVGNRAAERSTESPFRSTQTRYSSITQNRLWETLSTTPVFEQKDVDGALVWKFHPQPPPPPPPLLDSLTGLRSALPDTRPERDVTQKTMQTLSDFTGYIASQTYHMPFRYSAGPSPALTPEEDEIRREIKALKGLVLNRHEFLVPRRRCSLTLRFRRSFLPPRPTPPVHATSS